MNSILRDGRVSIGAAMVVEFGAMLLACFAYRGLAGGGALVEALGWIGVGIVVGLAWFVVSAVAVWSIIRFSAARGGAGDVPQRSRLDATGRTLVAGYCGVGLVIALLQVKYIVTHPIEWTDMAFPNVVTRVVVEVAAWPWTVFAFFGA